jgi:hypothetical protein
MSLHELGILAVVDCAALTMHQRIRSAGIQNQSRAGA